MRTLVAYLTLTASAFCADLPVAKPNSSSVTEREFSMQRSQNVDVLLLDDGRVKLSFPEYKVLNAAGNPLKVIVSNSFRVPLTKAEIQEFSSRGVVLPEGIHTFYFDWVDIAVARRAEAGPASSFGAESERKPSPSFSEHVVIDVSAPNPGESASVQVPWISADGLSEDALHGSIQLPPDKQLVLGSANPGASTARQADATMAPRHTINVWRDGVLQWANGSTIYQHIHALEQQYVRIQNDRVTTVGGEISSDVGQAKQGALGRLSESSADHLLPQAPAPSFEMLRSEGFFSLLIGDTYQYLGGSPDGNEENGALMGAAILGQLKGRVEKSIRYPNFSYQTDNSTFPGYYSGTAPSLGSLGTPEVSRFGLANGGQRNALKQLESRKPLAFFTEGAQGGSIIVQFPFAATDQKVRYTVYERDREYSIEHVGPTLGVYLLDDFSATGETSTAGKKRDANAEADLGSQQLQSINLSNLSSFSPGLSPSEKMKSLLKTKSTPTSGATGMTMMSLLSTTPADRAGLRAEYYSTDNLTGALTSVRTDSIVNWTSGTNPSSVPFPAGVFSVRWRGTVQSVAAGSYKFYTNTTGGVRLWVNGKLVVDNWTTHTLVENSGTVTLEANKKHNIMMVYKSAGGGTAQLSWEGPSLSKAIIPSSHLSPPGGAPPVFTSKEFSLGYGFRSGNWVLEPSTKNRPTTQDDFTVSVATAFPTPGQYSAYGPTFTDRTMADGQPSGSNQCGKSQGLTITVTGTWTGNLPGGSLQTSLVIDSIKIRGAKYGTGAENFQWKETTPGHIATSAAQALTFISTSSLTNLLESDDYKPLTWEPADYFVTGNTMTRTFTIVTSNGSNIPLDGLEIVARVKVISDPPAIESPAFSAGYGYSVDPNPQTTAVWKPETSTQSTSTTQGNFTVTTQFASPQSLYSHYGPQFTNRTLGVGPTGGNGKSASSNALTFTVNANWTGAPANSHNHRISLVIDSISIHGVKYRTTSTTGPVIDLGLEETTPGRGASLPYYPLPNTGVNLTNLADQSKYAKITWEPDDYYVDGTSTSRTFKLVTSDTDTVPVDGIEIEARVVVGFDYGAWNTSFEQGMADWNVLPIVDPNENPALNIVETNSNRVADGEYALQFAVNTYSPTITVVSNHQVLIPNTPYQQISYQYFYEHLPDQDYLHRKFGGRVRLYDSTGAALPTGGVFERPGGYISDGNWFPAVVQFAVPSDAAFYTIEFYWIERNGKIAFDDIRHTPITHAPVATATGFKLASFSDTGARDLWVASPLEKVLREAPVPAASPAATKLSLSAAQRESQSIQLVYRPQADETFTHVTVTNLVKTGAPDIASSNISVRYPNYLNITADIALGGEDYEQRLQHPSTFGQNGWMPDPLRLAPKNAEDNILGKLGANKAQPIWITVTVPATAQPGVYTGTVQLKTTSTTAITKNIPIELEVFGFAIPDKPSMKIAAGNGGAPYNRAKLREQLKANRIFSEMSHSGGTSSLPITVNANYSVTIDWPAWDDMMTTYQDTDGLTYYQVPYMQLGDISTQPGVNWLNNPALPFGSEPWRTALTSYVTQVHQHLTDNGWLGYSVWKIWDEPFRSAQADMVSEVAEIVRTHAPNAKISVTSWPQPSLYNAKIDIWLQPRPTFVKELPTPAVGTPESWIYNNDLYLVDRTWGLTNMRNNAWWMWRNEVKGLLWWNVAHGWGSDFRLDQDSYEGQDGGGNLFYSRTTSSTAADVDDSMRVSAFRDSVDDYDYLTLLSEKQTARRTGLGLSQAPEGPALVNALIDGVEGKNNPLLIERARFLAARLIPFLTNTSAPAVFVIDSDYLTTNKIKLYVGSGTTSVTNDGVAKLPDPVTGAYEIDFRKTTVITRGSPYTLPAAQ